MRWNHFVGFTLCLIFANLRICGFVNLWPKFSIGCVLQLAPTSNFETLHFEKKTLNLEIEKTTFVGKLATLRAFVSNPIDSCAVPGFVLLVLAMKRTVGRSLHCTIHSAAHDRSHFERLDHACARCGVLAGHREPDRVGIAGCRRGQRLVEAVLVT